MDNNVSFRPVQGPEAKIASHELTKGYFYCATDSGKIYLDTDDRRIPLGGSGAAIYYGNADNVQEDAVTKNYLFPKNAMEKKEDAPKEGDIIINADGTFYKVLDSNDEYYICEILALSGGGGGDNLRPRLNIEDVPANMVNGQNLKIYFTPISAKVEGIPVDDKMTLSWSVAIKSSLGTTNTPYIQGQMTVINEVRTYVELEGLRDSATSEITLTLSSQGHDKPNVKSFTVVTSPLSLNYPSGFSSTIKYNAASPVNLTCVVEGNLQKILTYYFDDDILEEVPLKASETGTQSIVVPTEYCTHGYHKVKIQLYYNSGTYDVPVKDENIEIPALEYEIPIYEQGNSTPIIWLGAFKNKYYNYETINIPYMVYNPSNVNNVHIIYNKNNSNIGEVDITNMSDYTYWEIPYEGLGVNTYKIICGDVFRQFTITIERDPKRPMEIVKQSNLKFNFDPTGRSNNESKNNRQKYVNNGISANFKDFNWHNNGWGKWDDDTQTSLKISNGASLEVPIGDLIFSGKDADQQSNTVEVQLRLTNIQNYTNLITNITRYKYKDPLAAGENDPEFKDTDWYKAFIASNQTQYNNYDAFLQANLSKETWLDSEGNNLNPKNVKYDDLLFDYIQKNINTKNLVMSLYTGSVGICIGTQDTFFTNGENTLSVSFVEKEMINLTFSYNHSLKLLFIFINGVITGVVKNSLTEGTFQIKDAKIIFNSNNCDISLYKLRVYNEFLNIVDICMNYGVDRKDVVIYDQTTALSMDHQTLGEYQIDFDKVNAYNETHLGDTYLMPYMILDTSVNSTDELPYSKKEQPIRVKAEFVNIPLELAYRNGELEDLCKNDGLISKSETNRDKIEEAVKIYYKHHCPSFTTTISEDLVDELIPEKERLSLTLQGTSSQFYPRKNFKGKTKCKKVDVWSEDASNPEGGTFKKESLLSLYMNRGPYANIYTEEVSKVEKDPKYYGHEKCRLSDGWYFNNYTNATDRWTFKVDYMESSGSYNAGFANMVANAYTKHPLKDYVDKGIFNGTENLNSPIKNRIIWDDYRTSMEGFPLMMFQKRIDGSYLFIGYYRMLLDKGSDDVLGFSPNKNVTTKYVKTNGNKDAKVKDIAECWEFCANNRQYCSFKDPQNRVKLSFLRDKEEGAKDGRFNANMGLNIVDNFEYRYNAYEDYLDILMNPAAANQEDLAATITSMQEEFGLSEANGYPVPGVVDSKHPEEALKAGKYLLYLYRNWEKVCQWVWSTDTSSVPSQGSYSKVPVGKQVFVSGKFFEQSDDGNYVPAISYDPSKTYYEFDSEEDTYRNAYICEEKYLYKKNTYYKKVDNLYQLIDADSFDAQISNYYELKSLSFEELDNICDRIMIPASGIFDSSKEYYTFINKTHKYDPAGNPSKSEAYTRVETPTEEAFNQGLYYESTTVTYYGIPYTHETKEYRIAKFKNEVSKHFDMEYLSVYFIMTEFFECYDSRGKNCMMASWGPQEEGGEYIWYPLFYDIDTQLGINNSGIPSFEFNVDATEANNFSTSDSILWNNFYSCFKDSYILAAYKNLKGTDQNVFDSISKDKAPLTSVDNIEKWYNFDPKISDNIACRGIRPLIATNLDMYFKYITITNPKAAELKIGWYKGNGKYETDDGTYFYALQGDRQQSRKQFLSNRMDYIDSWLGQGEYARGGSNSIIGRIAANDMSSKPKISDNWIGEYTNGKIINYWKDDAEYGTKLHDFDGEYWINMHPIRSSYVIAGEDQDTNYPPQKYDGVNTIQYELSGLRLGLATKANYHEQLCYIYGMNVMSEVNNLYNLYWAEIELRGSFGKMIRFELGHDIPSDTDFKDEAQSSKKTWYNHNIGKTSLAPMPLLKEMNLSNLGFENEQVIDLTASQKLENFRAIGASNLVSVKFAESPALNTLYLPSSITGLNLVNPYALTVLLTDKDKQINYDTISPEGRRIPPEGLYLEGYFNEGSADIYSGAMNSSITSLRISEDSLHYGSYKLLKRLYLAYKDTQISPTIVMKDINWSPYEQLTEGAVYDNNNSTKYYYDNGHYSLEPYIYTTDEDFNAKVLSNQIYYFNEEYFEDSSIIDDDGFNMLVALQDETSHFQGESLSTKPVISGIIYIDNNTAIDEGQIYKLQKKYQNLTIFANKVNKGYSAKFVIWDAETNSEQYVKFKDINITRPSTQKVSIEEYQSGIDAFEDPWTLYKPEKDYYDFLGWDTDKNAEIPRYTEGIAWAEKISADQFDYTYYAIFKVHAFNIVYKNYDDSVIKTFQIEYGKNLKTPDTIPYRPEDENMGLYETWDFVGYSLTNGGDKLDNIESMISTSDMTFYAKYRKLNDVRTIVHPEWFTVVTNNAQVEGYTNTPSGGKVIAKGCEIRPKLGLVGKITIPRMINDVPVVRLSNFNKIPGTEESQKITHIFMQQGSGANPVYQISSGCFNNVRSLVYFDFGNTNLNRIDNDGFMKCSLDISQLRLHECETVEAIAQNAFKDGLSNKKEGSTDIFIPHSVVIIGSEAFNYLNSVEGDFTVTIGSLAKKSKLNLALPSSEIANAKFQQNNYGYKMSVVFYSNLYTSENDPVGNSGNTVKYYFGPTCNQLDIL